MARQLNLRQIEAFKAVMESGTVSRAAEVLNITQPAISKLIAHLEQDTRLQLFDRVKGRLVPTEQAMRLHDEVGRIFAGVHQVESAVEALHREEQGRLTIGTLPALGQAFIERATAAFLRQNAGVFCSIQQFSSPRIIDLLIARKLDVGLIAPGFDNPYVTREMLMDHQLVCILPIGHPLAETSVLTPKALSRVPFVSYNLDSYTAHRINEVFEADGATLNPVIVANLTSTLCALVAGGHGVSLVQPLATIGMEDRIVLRRFEPGIHAGYKICRNPDNRNAKLVDGFVQALHATAAEAWRDTLKEK